MNALSSPDHENEFGKILAALEEEEYEVLSEVTRGYLAPRQFDCETDADSYYLYAKYLNLFANGYRRWQISYDYAGIRNCFYAASWNLSNAKTVPSLTPAFSMLTAMLNAYTRCENSFINDDPQGLAHHALEAQKAERKGLEFLAPFHSTDAIEMSIREWLIIYFEKNFQLHSGLEACADGYSEILKHKPCDRKWFEHTIGKASKALEELRADQSGLHSPELASELNAHIRIITQHYKRACIMEAESSPAYLRLSEGSVTLCLSAGCDANVARGIISSSEEFKTRLERSFNSCGIEMRTLRVAPLHDLFQTTFGSQFLQMLILDLPAIRVTVSDSHKVHEKSYEFAVKVKLTSLGSCTVYLTHEVDPTGLTIEEIRTLQSLICPHAGQVKIEIENPTSDCKTMPLLSFNFKERFEFSTLDELKELERGVGDRTSAQEALRRCYKSAIDEIENDINEFSGRTTFPAKPQLKDSHDQRPDNKELFTRMEELCELLRTYSPQSPEGKLRNQFAPMRRVTDFASWVLHRVESAFRERPSPDETMEGFDYYRRWMMSPDTGWYSYVHARSLRWEDSHGIDAGSVDSFDTDMVKSHSDVHGLLIEPREARASFDDWRFMSFNWKDHPNLAFIRSHPCDAFFVSQNRAFLFFPDDPKFLADQYEVTVELMTWLGTALKFCEGLSQRLVRDVTECFNPSGPGIEDGSIKEHLHWISGLRVQVGVVQALVSKTGISRYADHGELMTRVADNMKFHRIMELLDKRLNLFDEFYKKYEGESAHETENRSHLTDFFLIAITALIGIAAIPKDFEHRKFLILVIFCLIGILLPIRLSKTFVKFVYKHKIFVSIVAIVFVALFIGVYAGLLP